MLNEPTLDELHTMRLNAMAAAWLAQQKDPQMAQLIFDERFGLIVDVEHLARHNRRLTRRLSEPLAKWQAHIGDPTVADAILDRVVHQAYAIELKGPSRRKEREAKK